MLSPRQELILSKVVVCYQQTDAPVGSKVLSADPELNAGPSTIRNELALLEEHGLLAHPHTSAGRVPTDAGFRSALIPHNPTRGMEIEIGADGDRRRGAEMPRQQRHGTVGIPLQRRLQNVPMFAADVAIRSSERDRQAAIALALGMKLAMQSEQPRAADTLDQRLMESGMRVRPVVIGTRGIRGRRLGRAR